MISLDGYFEGENHDLSWHHADNDEFQKFVDAQNLTIGAILMGKTTFEMMRSFWPSEEGTNADPKTATFMTQTQKYVITHGEYEPNWENTAVIHGDVFRQIEELKRQPGKDLAIFGSNMLSVSLAEAGLIDEYRIMVNPIAIGTGTPLFKGISAPLRLTLATTRPFPTGNVLLTYTK